jgi:hypothetical protein
MLPGPALYMQVTCVLFASSGASPLRNMFEVPYQEECGATLRASQRDARLLGGRISCSELSWWSVTSRARSEEARARLGESMSQAAVELVPDRSTRGWDSRKVRCALARQRYGTWHSRCGAAVKKDEPRFLSSDESTP